MCAHRNFETIVLFVSVLLVDILVSDGRSHWLEGAQLSECQRVISTADAVADFSLALQSRSTSSSRSPSGSPIKPREVLLLRCLRSPGGRQPSRIHLFSPHSLCLAFFIRQKQQESSCTVSVSPTFLPLANTHCHRLSPFSVSTRLAGRVAADLPSVLFLYRTYLSNLTGSCA